jgi:hypothetical protein
MTEKRNAAARIDPSLFSRKQDIIQWNKEQDEKKVLTEYCPSVIRDRSRKR